MTIKLPFPFPSFHIIKPDYLKNSLYVFPTGKEIVKNLYVFFRPLSPDAIKTHAEKRKDVSFIAIDQLFKFGKTLENYHPGKIKQIFLVFQKKYENHEDRENLSSLEKALKESLNKFVEIHKKVLRKIEFTEQRKNEINASFERFSEKFNTLLVPPYNQEKLRDASILLDEFNETIMQSHQLYIGLDKVLDYIGQSNSSALQTLKEQFNPDLVDQGFNQILKKKANRARLFDLIADANVTLKTLVPKSILKSIGKNEYVKNELLKIILEENKKVVSFMQKRIEEHREHLFKKIKIYLNDNISSREDLQKKLELLSSDKKAQDFLLDLGKIRFCLKDEAPRSSCNTIKEKLELLLKEEPYLFTEREKRALTHLLEHLFTISEGKSFYKEDLEILMNRCQDIITELLPKKTIFSQIITYLSKLEICRIQKNITSNEHKQIIDLLNEFIKNPIISFKEDEKKAFLHLKEMLSFDPKQPIPKEKISSLQLQKCRKLIKEIEKRPPLKVGSKLATEQELEKLAKHITNLSLMISVDSLFFNSSRDSLFYRNIIQKSEELGCCPKQLFLNELKIQEFPTWKIVLAKICFFIIKHFTIEQFIHTTISRTISNYSKMIYEKLDQKYTHDQVQTISQELVENVTTYFHLLNSAISNAKIDAQRFPDQEQITRLIINQLLSLKLENNEGALKELNLYDLYNKLISDLVEKSESGLLKWIISHLNKQKKYDFASSMIKTGIHSFIKPDSHGNASGLDLLIRDNLRALYKKLQQPVPEKDFHEEPLLPNHLAKEFAEKFIQTLNQHRNIQQIISSKKVAIAEANFINILYEHGSKLKLGGILDQQIKNYEQINHNTKLLLDFQNTQILQGKDKEALFILPILRDKIMIHLKALEKFFLPTYSETTPQEHSISTSEILKDKLNTFIGIQVDYIIREKVTLAFTKLLKDPPSQKNLYDWIYQGLALANQAIEHPKDAKEKQDVVKEEITELLGDISNHIASTIPKIIINNFTNMERLSSKLAEMNPIDLPSQISPIIQERLQNIIDLTRQETLYQPELVAQLGKRIVFS